jgi:hypothetical protein
MPSGAPLFRVRPAEAAVPIMRKGGYEPDAWQRQVLEGEDQQLLLNCCRQSGKSTAVAVRALAEVLYEPGSMVVIMSASLRQSTELFRKIKHFYTRLGSPLKKRLTKEELELSHTSRVVSLPCKEATIRSYSGVTLLIIDEAARVPDDVYKALRPMTAVPGGRIILLSTPFGKRGFFYDAWANGGDDWKRIKVMAEELPRFSKEFLDRERRALSEAWYRQEYCCSFEALEGLVYPDFERCVVAGPAPAGGTPVGGMDFGFRNPFAALWGVHDRDGVLWLTGEHYVRQKPLSHHAGRLPRKVRWYADPSGANEISELRCAGFTVSAGDNDLRHGIAAVTARVEQGRLKVLAGACPNLLAEAGLYRYETEGRGRQSEAPVDEYNHALAALRYLVSKLDARHMARLRGKPVQPGDGPPEGEPGKKEGKRPWMSVFNEVLWHRL